MASIAHRHHHGRSPDPSIPKPPMGGSRNEAIMAIVALLILALIAIAFFVQATR